MLKKTCKSLLRVISTVFFVGLFTAVFCILSFVIYAEFSPDLKVREFHDIAKAQDKSTKLY